MLLALADEISKEARTPAGRLDQERALRLLLGAAAALLRQSVIKP
jgi:hypothetical protein